MKIAQIVLPAILFAICKAQPYESRDYDEPINMANNFFKNLEAQQKSEQLIEQYRYLIAKSLLRLKDACKVYDFLTGVQQKWFEEGEKEQLPLDEPQTDTEQYIKSLINVVKESNNPDMAAIFAKENSNDTATNILFYFVTTSAMLKDPELDLLIRDMLHDQCCEQYDGSAVGRRNCVTTEKRDGTKKVRFHSWGGKRNSGTPTVVIRTPFRPWGGKRAMRPYNEINS